jgi:pimeloyl-ACP methyl ester carboxylesterase
LIDPLARAGYHVWAVDFIGYGLSDKPEHVTYHLDFFLDQLTSFMEAKGITKAHLVGNSMGGGLALNLALSYPLQVSSLSLFNALGYPLELPFSVSICRHISHLWSPFLGPRMVRHTLKSIVYNGEEISDEQVEAYCLPYRLPGGIAATLLTLQQFDNRHLVKMTEQYSALKHPMLIIWGEKDSQIPFSHYEKFVHDFPSAKKLLISKCGHMPQEETPHEVLSTLLEFLQEH